MSEKINCIPLSSIRRRVDALPVGTVTGQVRNSRQPVLFLPKNISVWKGTDTDHFHKAYCHHRMILKILLKGEASTNIEGIRYRILPGDAVLYFPCQTHSTEKDRGNDSIEYLAVSFVAGLGDYAMLSSLKNRVFRPDLRKILQLAESCFARLSPEKAVYLLGLLLAEAAGNTVAGSPAFTGDPRFRMIADYIRQHCMEPISIKTIAAAFELSPPDGPENLPPQSSGCLARQTAPGTAARPCGRTADSDIAQCRRDSQNVSFFQSFCLFQSLQKINGSFPEGIPLPCRTMTPWTPKSSFPRVIASHPLIHHKLSP